jgi:hypothetical protein
MAYWLFFGLIVRNTVSFPRPALQAMLTLSLVVCYGATAGFGGLLVGYLGETEGHKLLEQVFPSGDINGQLLLQVLVLLLFGLCCSLADFIRTRQGLRFTTA